MRIVIKVGTNLLTSKDGSLNFKRIEAFTDEVCRLRDNGAQVALVTSGAVGAGMGKVGLTKRPGQLRDKQALAAIGQPLLMDAYQKYFSSHKMTIAQVLLTRHDFDDRQRYINVRSTLHALLDMGVVPVINENDTVAVEELNFGDNDTLSAMVAATICADWLFLFTDVDGLYKGMPGKSDIIRVVEKVTPEIESYASGESASGKGTGGMTTKLIAAKIATAAGVKMVITNGAKQGDIEKILSGEPIGTVFLPHAAIESRKCWIAFGTKSRGKIIVDDGAAVALTKKGKSLLPSGIISVEGKFEVGEQVAVFDKNRTEIARGLTQYSAADIERIKGRKSSEIAKILGNADYEEAIHRDNLVVL